MTQLNAAIWNAISRQELETPAAKIAFRLNGDQIAAMENYWYRAELKAGLPHRIASPLVTCLPLLAEHSAIQAYLARHPESRQSLPEILNPQEAVSLMAQEWRLNSQEKKMLLSALESPGPHLQRWGLAAKQAA